jgi:hypothetical protein
VTVVDPHPKPMEMFLRHPPEHERAGQRVARPQVCGCGARFFQARIDPAWLDRMPAERSTAFVKAATDNELDGSVWLPKACPQCERREIHAVPKKE